MSVQIKVVESKSELKTFVRFANKLYKDNKYYVPAIIFDELATFNKEKNGAFAFCDAELYLAYKDGKVVGRIAAIINH
ncbi:MAG: N-acetyltransferase, partial [Alistipes sp.]|nr:N-acetyltransferase [Alistipes sp.]